MDFQDHGSKLLALKKILAKGGNLMKRTLVADFFSESLFGELSEFHKIGEHLASQNANTEEIIKKLIDAGPAGIALLADLFE